MTRRLDRRQLSFVSEISVTPLLNLVFLLLLGLMMAAPLLKNESPPVLSAAGTDMENKAPTRALPAPVIAAPSDPVPGKPKFQVTLSHKTEEPVTSAPAPAADMAGVDRAIVEEFKRNWVLPADFDTGGTARETQMDVVLARDGRFTSCMLAKPSGHSMVDMAALRAADLAKRIPMPLPPQFLGDSYVVQLHFRAQ